LQKYLSGDRAIVCCIRRRTLFEHWGNHCFLLCAKYLANRHKRIEK